MWRFISSALGITIILGLLFGCATRSDFTVLSSKNVNLSSIKVDKSRAKGTTSGKDCQHTVILFPVGRPATLDEALDRALKAKQANLLLDAVVKYMQFQIPYVYGQECWTAEGVAYDTGK